MTTAGWFEEVKMRLFREHGGRQLSTRLAASLITTVLTLAAVWSSPAVAAEVKQRRFASAEAGVEALMTALKAKDTQGKPLPYYGYYYRILKAQGADAPGGAYDYVVHGKMIGGFALVAYPANSGNSGVMTFIVNHDGVVYQKDLGPDTAVVAQAMTRFNPDRTWTRL
jgi:Protein of unknown function (DUF2950)